jgi:predicted transcriptional regulator
VIIPDVERTMQLAERIRDEIMDETHDTVTPMVLVALAMNVAECLQKLGMNDEDFRVILRARFE